MRGKWGHLGYANIRIERKEYRNVKDTLAGREVIRGRDVKEVIQVGGGGLSEVEHSGARRSTTVQRIHALCRRATSPIIAVPTRTLFSFSPEASDYHTHYIK